LRGDVSKAFEECLRLLKQGYQIADCVSNYPGMRDQLEPLLETAQTVSSAPRIVPSDQFRLESKARLISRIRQEAAQADMAQRQSAPASGWLGGVFGGTGVLAFPPRRLFAPAMSVMFLALAAVMIFNAVLALGPASPDLGSQCTLSLLSGDVEYMVPGTASWEAATDGMTLEAGSRVKTDADSKAVLTFFEGSTIELEPGTDVEVEQVEGDSAQSAQIVLKQWVGTTWSRVVKKVDPGSRYEVQTPSAYALVRGTEFEVEVDDTGATAVRTYSGLVSVIGQDQEVYVPAGHQVGVQSGQPPADLQPVPEADNGLVVEAVMPAVASLVDPSWASTGHLPSGVAFNQIPRSQLDCSDSGLQTIAIVDPIDGTYRLILRGAADGTARVTLRGIASGTTAFELSESYAMATGSEWIVRIDLEFANGRLVGATLGDIEPLGTQAADNVIVAPLAKEAATPVGEAESEQEHGSGSKDGVQLTPTVPPVTQGSESTNTDGPVATAGGEPSETGAGGAEPGGSEGPDGPTGDVPGLIGPSYTVRPGSVSSDKYILTIVAIGGGLVTEPGQGVFTYEKGAVVDLVATPKAGWSFYSWTGNVEDSASPITRITMNQAQTVTASFISVQ